MADLCGARTRSGGMCKKAPIAGKTRCCLHEELSAGDLFAHEDRSAQDEQSTQCAPAAQSELSVPSTQNVQSMPRAPSELSAIAHGFYTDALQPDELDLWGRIEIGSLDDEIRLMKMKLRRLVRLAASQEVADLAESMLDAGSNAASNVKRNGARKGTRKSNEGEGEHGAQSSRETECGEERTQQSKSAALQCAKENELPCKTVASSGRTAAAGSRSTTRTAAAHYADLIIKALDQIRKLERARIGLKLAEGGGHGTGMSGFIFTVKRVGSDDT